MIDKNTFKTVVQNSPLVSIDLIVKQNTKILIGKRVNKPAIGCYFTSGGRIFKNEKITDAIARITKEELGMSLKLKTKFIGVFEHLYDDSIFEDVSVHYINLGYEISISSLKDLPYTQHSEYIWIDEKELMQRDDIHDNVKLYFKIRR